MCSVHVLPVALGAPGSVCGATLGGGEAVLVDGVPAEFEVGVASAFGGFADAERAFGTIFGPGQVEVDACACGGLVGLDRAGALDGGAVVGVPDDDGAPARPSGGLVLLLPVPLRVVLVRCLVRG